VCAAVILALAGGARWVQVNRGYVVAMQRGSDLVNQKKPDEAILELQRALAHEPNSPEIHLDLARAYHLKGQDALAEAELKRSLSLDLHNDQARYTLGYTYIEQKRFPEARKAFQDVLTLNPKSADAHNALAYIAAQEGNHEAAIAEYRMAIELDSENGDYYSLGASYERLNRLDEAIAAYKRSQEVYGDDQDTEMALASAYRAKGMAKEAEEAAAKATQLK
jgi:tetratricopeptide (TPR) repeat protein